jgi:hypothetical protein
MASPLGDLPVDDPDVAREEGFEILAAGFGDL